MKTQTARRDEASFGAVLLLVVPIAVVAIAIVGCDGPETERVVDPDRPSPLLVEVTDSAGVDFRHDPVAQGDFLFPEINGAGCAVLDYDNDGLLDLYLVQSGRDLKDADSPVQPNRLFRNLGGWKFEDRTEQSGAGDTGYGQGVAVGDYDNDGWVDLYVANVGGPSVLLRNNGDGTFTDVTVEAGVGNGGWVITPAFLDYDSDGDLDLFSTNYVRWSVEIDIACFSATGARDYCGPRNYQPAPSILYRNNGDGTFTDVSSESGITTVFGAGMGIVCADFDDDGFTDIYVANDAHPNQLWMNRGDGTFVDRAPTAGCAVGASGAALSSMGTNVEDFDGDGDLDLFSTNYHSQGSVLYLQEADGLFLDISAQTRLFATTAARTGFGACALDLFTNGGLALYIGNGAAVMGGAVDTDRSPYAQNDSVLLWRTEDRRFEDITARVGSVMNSAYVSRGVAAGDLDNDGAVDLLINNNDGPARVLRNTAAPDNHWILVRCLTADGTRDALGATVWITVDGTTRRRDVLVHHSYGSASDPRVHLGLGASTEVDRLEVRWPGGQRRVWTQLPADQVFEARPTGEGLSR
jgi:hypothetical protein